jgi:hypothetical protein
MGGPTTRKEQNYGRFDKQIQVTHVLVPVFSEAVFSMPVVWDKRLAVVFAACCSLSKNFGDLGVADLPISIEPEICVCRFDRFDRFVMFQDVSRC